MSGGEGRGDISGAVQPGPAAGRPEVIDDTGRENFQGVVGQDLGPQAGGPDVDLVAAIAGGPGRQEAQEAGAAGS